MYMSFKCQILLVYMILLKQNSISECIIKNGLFTVTKQESPCNCNNYPCQEGYQCNEFIGGCISVQSSSFDYVKVLGKFSFNSIQIDDYQRNTIRELDSKFNTIGEVGPAKRTIFDVGDGNQWIKYSARQSPGMPSRTEDTVVQLRKWADHSVLKAGYFLNIDTHELRPGNHKYEMVVVNKFVFHGSNKTKFAGGLSILDFSGEVPTQYDIDTTRQFDPDVHWDPDYSKYWDWMHANTAGVDIIGNYYLQSRYLSTLIVFDKDTKDKLWVLSSQFETDYEMSPEDRSYKGHDIHQLANGNWLIQDNGNQRPAAEGGEYSRCIEQKLDNQHKKAVKVWEQRIDALCDYCGSCRRMENGHTLIGFFNCITPGVGSVDLSLYQKNQVLEVDMDGLIIGQAKFNSWEDIAMQRAIPSINKVINNSNDENGSDIDSNKSNVKDDDVNNLIVEPKNNQDFWHQLVKLLLSDWTIIYLSLIIILLITILIIMISYEQLKTSYQQNTYQYSNIDVNT